MGRFTHRCRRSLGRRLVHVHQHSLRRALGALVGARKRVLMMHSALGEFGYVVGGEGTVIEGVGEFCETLCLPTHTYCYPADIRDVGPVYDPESSESQVGRVTNFFRRRPGVIRSIHPTHSLAALGREAREITAGHERCGTPCGAETPYEKLVAMDAAVLMFGATMNSYTLFHTAEDAARCDYLYEPQPYRLRAQDGAGVVHELAMRRQDMRVPRQFAAMDTVLEKEGLLRRRRLGVGQLLYVESANAVHTFLVAQLRRDPLYLTHESYRNRRA